MLKLRISGGKYKQKTLNVSKAARPLMEKAKNAVFSIIQDKLTNASVLDLFAGSGNLGIEAISRGAKDAIFVDDDYYSIKSILENTSNIIKDETYEVIKSDAVKFVVNDHRNYDVIFLDPPYDQNVHHILKFIDRNLKDTGILLYFTNKKTDFDGNMLKNLNPALKLVDFRDYGITRVHFMVK